MTKYIKKLSLLIAMPCMIISCNSGFDEVSKNIDLFIKASGNYVNLENVSNLNYGTGTFGDEARVMTDDLGLSIASAYDQFLDGNEKNVNIYDTGTDGYLMPGKFFRIVENGKNIADAAGLNIKLRAKDLSTIISPPADECYVDTVRGRFVLPRPVYWSKCDNYISPSVNSMSQPLIGIGYSEKDGSGGVIRLYTGFKFGNGLEHYTTDLAWRYWWFGMGESYSNPDTWSNKGTVSFWVDPNNMGNGQQITIKFKTNTWFRLYNYNNSQSATLVVNGTTVKSTSFTWSLGVHIYIIWNISGGLAGSNTIKVFLDNTEWSSSIISFTVGDCILESAVVSISSTASIYSDNLKIWNDVVSEDPSFEYNSGSGREEALHPIYGESNNYAPILDDSSNPAGGVGYYYVE